MEKINKFFGYKNEVFDKTELKKKTKKSLPIIKKIKEHQPLVVSGEKTISFSQIQMYNDCPHKWNLQYKQKLYESAPSINMTFGTALHETVQHYLGMMYNESVVKADEFDLEEYFQERFTEVYKRDLKSNKDKHFSSQDEMHEFYNDGLEIIKFLKSKRGEYFSKRDWHLVGCEIPLIIKPNNAYNNVIYKGFIDVVLYHEKTNKFYIIDIKTSRQGWSSEKKDEVKQAQLLLYKLFFSEQFEVPLENIDLEFVILKRKLWENSSYPQKRIQSFVPPNGVEKVNKAKKLLDKFLEECFDQDGYKERKFEMKPSSKCKWCPFNSKPELCSKKDS